MKARDRHLCHAVGCREPVPPKMLMCRAHWFMVPKNLQRAVWASYREGQEAGGERPSEEWLEAATDAIRAVATEEGRPVPPRYERRARNAKGEPVEILL